MKFLNITLLAAGAFALTACSGYHSLYTETADEISSVRVESVQMVLDGNRGVGLRRPAQLVNKILKQTFTSQGDVPYTLSVDITENTESLAVRSDGVSSRVRLTMVGSVSLQLNGEEVFHTNAEARSPYNVESTPYSTESGIDNVRNNIARTLADEITHRVNFYLYQQKQAEK